MLVAAGCSGKTLNGAAVRPDPARRHEAVSVRLHVLDGADAKALTCLVDFLEGHGAKAESAGGAVTATGSFDVVGPALGLVMVANYQVTCLACTEWSTLTSEQCAQDAFCAPITGKRTNPTNSCLEPTQTIGCMETPNGCVPEPSAVVDPQGACWLVDCGGDPAGWAAVGDQSCPGVSLGSPSLPLRSARHVIFQGRSPDRSGRNPPSEV
jgi:hypothetical protein